MGSSPIRVAISGSVAQLVEQWTENPRVTGSIPVGATICGFSSSGRAPPCQGGGSEFEPRNPLQNKKDAERRPFCFGFGERRAFYGGKAAALILRERGTRKGSPFHTFPSLRGGGAAGMDVAFAGFALKNTTGTKI